MREEESQEGFLERKDIGIYVLKDEFGWPDKGEKMETRSHIPEKRSCMCEGMEVKNQCVQKSASNSTWLDRERGRSSMNDANYRFFFILMATGSY